MMRDENHTSRLGRGIAIAAVALATACGGETITVGNTPPPATDPAAPVVDPAAAPVDPAAAPAEGAEAGRRAAGATDLP